MSASLSDLNFLSANRAVLTIPSLPETSYSLNKFKIPGLSLPAAVSQTPFRFEPFVGDKLQYDDLECTFIVTANLSNWLELYSWLRGISAPSDKSQFRNKDIEYEDLFITVFSSQNNPILKIVFENAVITQLEGIDFDESITETTTRTCDITFKYSAYEITTTL